MEPAETVAVSEKKIGCDGGGGALGHPMVYLTIQAESGAVDCPYCGKRFVLHPVPPSSD